MKTFSVLLTTIAFFLFSCGSGSSSGHTAASAPPAAYDNTLAKGTVTGNIACKNQSDQSYALYLPSYYSPTKKFPCVYLFDPHACGAIPLNKYKTLAEKYGFILVGSNTSKNGMQWDAINDVVKTLMQDTRARLNIDTQRIYAAGFSGGSRVASSVAILDGGIAGVIGCGLGFPQVQDPFARKFDYFGIVGEYDFNISDLRQLNDALAQNGFSHQLLTFNGKHEWPPVAGFKTGILWIQANAMKEHVQTKNDSLIAELKNDYDNRIALAKTAGDLIKEYELANGIANALNGLADVTAYQKQAADIVAGAAYKNEVAMQAQSQEYELSQQQDLAKQFAARDQKWWAGKIAELNKNSRNAKTRRESRMYKRLVNFLGMVGYLNSNHALDIGDLTNAATYLKVFKIADPQNPDVSYLTAVYYMKTGNQPQALSALNEAASLGYSDQSQLITDPSFGSILSNAEFGKIVAKVKENESK